MGLAHRMSDAAKRQNAVDAGACEVIDDAFNQAAAEGGNFTKIGEDFTVAPRCHLSDGGHLATNKYFRRIQRGAVVMNQLHKTQALALPHLQNAAEFGINGNAVLEKHTVHDKAANRRQACFPLRHHDVSQRFP